MLGIELLQGIGDSGAEDARVFEGEPDMLVVLRSFLFFLFFLGLHALDEFLLHDGVAKGIHEVYDLHIGIRGFSQGVVHPLVGLAADVDEEIAGGDLHNVIYCRLVAVQIYAAVKQHRELGAGRVAAEDLTDPVVQREDRDNNLQSSVILHAACRRRAHAASGQQAQR